MSQGLKNKITIYRFVLIFFVISIHTWNLSVYGIEWGISAFGSLIWFVESYFNTLETVCVPFFFVISGYLFFREFKLRSLPYKWKSRFRTVVIPYFLWASLYYCYYLLVTRLGVISSEPVGADIQTYLRWLWPDSYFVLWFLKELIIAVLFAPTIYFALYNRFIGAVVCLFLVLPHNPLIPEWVILPNLFFVVGAYIALHYHQKVEMQFSKRITALCRGGLFVLLIYNGWAVLNDRTPSNIFLLTLIAAFWGCVSEEEFSSDSLPWWMKTTMFIYCAHDLFLEAFEKIVLWVFGQSYVAALADYILMPFFSVFVVITIAGLMQRFTPKTYGILTGNR